MHEIHSRWRTPKGSRKKGAAARANALKRWAGRPNPSASTTTNPQASNTSTSTSGRKISTFSKKKENLDTSTESIESDIGEAGEYLLIHKSFWNPFVERMMCEDCKINDGHVKFTEQHGFVNKVVVRCQSCHEIMCQGYTSPRVTSDDAKSSRPPFTCNRKVVDAFLDIGTGNRQC